jgi:hypothetical protein
MFLNIPVGSTSTQFDLRTGAPKQAGNTPAPASQNPPIRQTTRRAMTREEQDGIVQAQLAAARRDEENEAARKKLADDASMESALAWLRSRSTHEALCSLYLMFKSLEAKNSDV